MRPADAAQTHMVPTASYSYPLLSRERDLEEHSKVAETKADIEAQGGAPARFAKFRLTAATKNGPPITKARKRKTSEPAGRYVAETN